MIRNYLIYLLVFVCGPAAAHHAATGRYEPDGFGEIEGEITDIFWRNPHVRFLINRTGDDGEDEEWEVEFGSVNTVERIGVSRDLVSVGDRVSVYGRMGRDGLRAMFARSIVMPNGEEVPLQAGVEQRYGLTESAFRDARNTDVALRADIDWRYVDDLGTPQSEDAVIEERFTMSEDGVRLDWVARINDPVNFTEPVVMEGAWTWVPGHEIKPFNCALPEQAD